MKVLITVLLVAFFGMLFVFFGRAYTVVETSGGGEYLILKAEQAKECETGGGCAVFSQREFFTTLSQALRGRM